MTDRTRRTSTAARRPKSSATRPIELVLIDDNRLLLDGLTAMIHAQPGFRVLAASADAAGAFAAARSAKPDVVLLDFGLADHDSLALTATVRLELPEAKLIVMGLRALQEDVADYVRAGASGFIMKDASFEEFFETIRQVASGTHVLPKALTSTLFSAIVHKAAGTATPRDSLVLREGARVTAREREVIEALADGLSNKEIAARLHIAVHTVKSHVHNVLEKLALRSRLEVAAFTHREADFRRKP